MEGSPEGKWVSDKVLVETLLRDMNEVEELWEALIVEA